MDPEFANMPHDYFSNDGSTQNPSQFENSHLSFFRYYGNSEMSDSKFQGEVHADLGLLAV